MKEIIFPATAEKFLAYQEKLAARPLSNNECEVTAVYLEILNDIYREAVEGSTALFETVVRTVKASISKYADNEALGRFMRAFFVWCDDAREQGCQDAEKAVMA